MSQRIRVFSCLALSLSLLAASGALGITAAPSKGSKGKQIGFSSPPTATSAIASPVVSVPIPASQPPVPAPSLPPGPVHAGLGGAGGQTGDGDGTATTPEPGTFALFGLGLAVLARRRGRATK